MISSFDEFDIDGLRYLPADLATMSMESLCANFHFPAAALQPLSSDRSIEAPAHYQTIAHETTHLIHALTTPFGHFVHAIQAFQSFAIADIAQVARRAGLKITIPLIKWVSTLEGSVAEHARGALQCWIMGEVLVRTLVGDTDVRLKLQLEYPDVGRITLPEMIALMTANLVEYYGLKYEHLQSLGWKPRSTGNVFLDYELEALADLDESKFWHPDQINIMDAALNINALTVIESAATVAEFWRSGWSFAQFRAWFDGSDPASKYSHFNKGPIQIALTLTNSSTLEEFVLTYLALCEIALYAPILPQHYSIRNETINVKELMPSVRWLSLIGAAKDVTPVRSLHDSGRFATEICKLLGWATPIQVAGASLQVPYDLDLRGMLFAEAQEMRIKRPSFFLDYDFLLFSQHPDAIQFRFPAMSFTDRTILHPDASYVHLTVLLHLEQVLLRRMLLKGDLQIRCPYPASQDERNALTNDLLQFVETTFGISPRGLAVL